MVICYSGKSKPSAHLIAEYLAESGDVLLRRDGRGDINWGRHKANSKLNPDITTSTNKRVMRELFAEAGVPMPQLVSWSDVSSDLSRGIVRKVVGRPDKHMKGRGFWLVDSVESMVKAMRGTRKKKAATHFMEYIEAEHEYRVHIFLGKSIRMTEKQFTGQDGNHKEYVTIKPTCSKAMRRQLRKAAKQAVKALKLDFGAVDVITKGDEVYVLEVNAAPGLGGSMPRVYGEAFRRWADGEH